MSLTDEKTVPTDPVTDMDTSKPPSQTGDFSDSSGTPNKEIENAPSGEDEYPHGLRLFLLASASIMGVFLISLDQVLFLSSPTFCRDRMELTGGDRPS